MERLMGSLFLLVLVIVACDLKPEGGNRGATSSSTAAGGGRSLAFEDLTLKDILALKEAGDARTLARVLASRDTPHSLRLLVALAVPESGPRARDFISVLRELTGEGELKLRMTCAFALWQVDGDAVDTVPVLIEALQVSDPRLMQIALDYLGRMGKEAHESAEAVRALVVDESVDPATRAQAADALWRVTGDLIEAVPALIDLLSFPDAQRLAALALGSIGLPHAAEAVGDLRAILEREPSPDVLASIAGSLARLGEAEIALRGLMLVLGDEDASIAARRNAIAYLADMGADARAALPLLERIGRTGPRLLSPMATHAEITIQNQIPAADTAGREK